MTPAKFFVARVAQAFGIHRKTKRMSDAASEMHLLRDAETFLGNSVWENVAEIDELSVEYWNLRKLVKERDSIRERLQACEEQLAVAHAERSTLLNSHSETQPGTLDERGAVMARLESLARKRDEIVARAREVRRSYDGLKMKLEVLSKEFGSDTPDAVAAREKLEGLKSKFAELKQQRAEVAEAIEAGDAELDACEAQLSEQRQSRREQASQAFQIIGDANREISAHRAELGLIDTQMRQLQAEIGRYVSRNPRNQACSDAAREHRGLVEVMRALRASIAMNHRLAGQA
ncbi:hypothetical protein KBB96_18570 [Luteolibacter ambystomatis]|uniref:Uncharacterized protein n=1 Tax=Luteolibacter ambystomatis TaxID=2824561 RepID=A0A975IYX1_9BACT|nr:hypothetical protein [Luteolibacter ambystomatis]QUE50851.1 hypothetical protein KBB96_18570 [Luteolibacter ambystomatis]